MPSMGMRAAHVAARPGAFAWQVLRAFRANQGFLLSGAVAYYTLLSIVPLMILLLIGLSHFIDQADLLATLARYLEWVTPGQSTAVMRELAGFLEHRDVMGWILLVTMLFFSTLAFTVLENAMSVIFLHRVAIRRRHFMVSAIIPFFYMFFLGLGLMLMTLVSGSLQAVGADTVDFLGRNWSLRGTSGVLFYILGIVGEIFVLTSIYLVMPVGRPSWQHALIAGVTSTLLWEITRHVLVWYFGTLSQIEVVYGTLTTAIAVMLSLELAATLLLLGAQVMAEYERIDVSGRSAAPVPMST